MNTTLEHKSQAPNQRAQQHESQSAKAFPSRTIVHAKLEMTEPGDHDEQEANAMANAVVNEGKIARKISDEDGGSSGLSLSPEMESQLALLQNGGHPKPQSLLSLMGNDSYPISSSNQDGVFLLDPEVLSKIITTKNDEPRMPFEGLTKKPELSAIHPHYISELVEKLGVHETFHILNRLGVGRIKAWNPGELSLMGTTFPKGNSANSMKSDYANLTPRKGGKEDLYYLSFDFGNTTVYTGVQMEGHSSIKGAGIGVIIQLDPPSSNKNENSNDYKDLNKPDNTATHTIIHPKLEMTEPGDHNEREADAVANTIVSGGKIARKISSRGSSSSGIAVSQQMESRLSQLQGGGRPMPQGLLNMMENGFGQNFGQVRIHTDAEAADMSSSIGALAFTLGNDIYFNRGQFSPETTEGKRLVAHELTHVAQETGKVGRDSIGPNQSQTKKESASEADFFSNLNLFINLIQTYKLFRNINAPLYVGETFEVIRKYNFAQLLQEGFETAKLAQAGNGAARAIYSLKKGFDLGAWLYCSYLDIKRANEKYNSKVEFVYYSLRALATISECPFVPWPPIIKSGLLVFNTSSSIGDLINEIPGVQEFLQNVLFPCLFDDLSFTEYITFITRYLAPGYPLNLLIKSKKVLESAIESIPEPDIYYKMDRMGL